jgi:adenosylhomocysteine nucleosidase
METIGLIAAMTQESKALLRRVKDAKPMQVGVCHGSSFELAGRRCVQVTSGMGMRRASEAARTLIEAASPSWLISFGIAGGVEAGLEIGDVIEAEWVCRLEGGVTTPLQHLEAWPEAARKTTARALVNRSAHLFVGTAVTTGGSQVAEGQLGGMQHPILEMETAGIAQVASEKGIPLLSIRAISDGPEAPIPIDLADIMDEDGNLHPGRMFMAVLRHPRIVIQGIKTMRNSMIAADNAALAVVEVLSNLP